MLLREKLKGLKLITTIALLSFFTLAVAQERVNEAQILSVYHGFDPIPARATALCGLPPMDGQDGMPVVFSVQINIETVSATAVAGFFHDPGDDANPETSIEVN